MGTKLNFSFDKLMESDRTYAYKSGNETQASNVYIYSSGV